MKKKNLVEGIVVRNPRGFGWLIVEDGPKDLFIPPRDLESLLDGDRVRCQVAKSPKGPVAHLESILSRSEKTIVGTLERRGSSWRVVLPEGILGGLAYLDKAGLREGLELVENAAVELKITKFPKKGQLAEVVIEKVLGIAGDFSTEIQKLISDSNVLDKFPLAVTQEAAQFGAVPSAQDQKGRLDLKGLALCTIDGKTAKDFDDAVFAAQEGENFRVIVAIADVSHYVTEDSALDKQAFSRATSIYYPGNCIPMLPENLSNGLCSLMPKVDRLCVAAEMLITPKGAVKSVKLHNAVMKSHARLTYQDVQIFLDGNLKHVESSAVKDSLLLLRQAALALRGARQKRGAIDFDIVESIVALDDKGEPVNIHPDERLESHRLIEDLMVATNEAVAAFVEKKGWPNLFRVHDEPSEEKLAAFYEFGEALGLITAQNLTAWKKKTKAQVLAIISKLVVGHPAQMALNTMLLRTMQQAQYSARNIGHFGLASVGYLHFTSPIRRYPDLIVHRLVKEIIRRKTKFKLSPEDKDGLVERLQIIAERCSLQERKAVELERAISAFHSVWFMRSRIGVTDEATVTGCAEFGVFIKLLHYHVEGLVHVTNMKKAGFMEFDSSRMRLTDKKSGFSIGLGDKVTARLTSVDLAKRRIDFELV